jgi:hypothetical protein
MAPSTNESTIRLIDEDEFPEKPYQLPQKRRSRLSYAVLWVIVLVQAVVILVQHERARTACTDPLYLYCMYILLDASSTSQLMSPKAPVEDAVKYELKTYAFDKGSPFQSEPSPEVDRVWKELYSSWSSLVLSKECYPCTDLERCLCRRHESCSKGRGGETSE